jgi:Ubiquitin family
VWVENTLVGKGFQVVVDESATVRHVKVEAERASGVPWRRQVLALHGTQVLDDDAQMLATLPPPWRVSLLAPLSFDYVQLTDATDNTVFVVPVDTGVDLVATLLNQITPNGYERRVGAPLTRVLLFRGKPLQPERTLASYKITKGDHLRLNR